MDNDDNSTDYDKSHIFEKMLPAIDALQEIFRSHDIPFLLATIPYRKGDHQGVSLIYQQPKKLGETALYRAAQLIAEEMGAADVLYKQGSVKKSDLH